MIRTIVGASLGLALMAPSAEAQVYCRAEGVAPGVGAGSPGVGVAPRDGVDVNGGGPGNRAGRR